MNKTSSKKEFYESQAYSIVMFIFLICCGFCMSGLFLFSALSDPDVRFLSFIPILMLLFCFYLCICFYAKIIHPKPYVIIDSKGIQYNGTYFDINYLPKTFLWKEIRNLSIKLLPRNVLALEIKTNGKVDQIFLQTMDRQERKMFIRQIESHKHVQDDEKLLENYSGMRYWFITLVGGLVLSFLLRLLNK